MFDSYLQMRKPVIVKKADDLGKLILSEPDGVEIAVSMIEEVIREIRYN